MDKFAYKYLFVEHKIRKSIRDLEVDTKLNGERIIAKELGISYMTVRKAVEHLVVEGVLYKIPKRGTYVADRVQ
jgi:DNA-binding GntR family transcriptional regulator